LSQASLNIRKGKKFPVIDITCTIKYEAADPSVPEAKPAHGLLHVVDLISDEVEDEFDVRMTPKTAGAKADRARLLLAGAAGTAVRGVFRSMLADLREKDGGATQLAEDADRRKDEAERMAAAVEATADEKTRIAEARRQQEVAMAEAEKAKAAAAAAMSPAEAVTKQEKPAGQGSVWNPNSYHWEEKPLTEWAMGHLKELLLAFDCDIPGGTFKIVDIEGIKGEASNSIRKGKKLFFWDFDIKGKWEGELVDGEGNMLATADGDFHIPEIDQDTDFDDAYECEVRIIAADDADSADLRLKEFARKAVPPRIRELLKQFVADMRER